MSSAAPPLRGRDTEHELLRRRLREARDDGRGQVVVVTGAPGSGKTRLLQAVHAMAVDAGARVLHVAGDPDATLEPHGPVLHAVQAGPDPLLDRTVLAGLPVGAEQGWWLRQELQARLQQVAVQQPVVVCVDDLQWCEHGTLRLLRALPPQLAADAVLWVVAVRSGTSDPAVTATVRALRATGAARLDLRPLDDEAVALLVGDVLGAVPDTGVLASAARAGGLPLLLVELLRGWRDEQLVRLDEGRARLVADVLPARLRDAVDRRTERVSPLALELLQIGAVLGRRFPPDLLAAVLERPPPTVLGPLQELVGAGLLQDEGDQIGFGHDLIREAVVASIPGAFARTLRRHAADVLRARGAPSLQVATMLAESAVPGDLAAVAVLREAAASLADTASPAAADFSLRALELLPQDSPLRAEVVVESVLLLLQSGRAAAAEQLASGSLTGALGLLPEAEARIRLGLARFLTRFSSREAVQHCETALALPGLPEQLRMQLLLLSAVNHGLSGDPDAADAVLVRVRAALTGEPDRATRVLVRRVESYVAFHRREWDRGFERHRQVVREMPAEDESLPAMWEASMWTSVGRPERALALADPELSAARRDGRLGSVLMWSSLRARALFDAGRLEESRAEAEATLSVEEIQIGGGVTDKVVVYSLVRGAVHAGRPDLLREHRPRVQRMCGDRLGQVRRNGLWLTALVLDAGGDPDGALQAAAEAIATLDQPGPSFAAMPDLADEVVLTRLALRCDDRVVATRAVAAAERRAAANPSYPMAAAAALHARGLLQADEASLRQAVDLLGRSERPLLLASAREDLARLVAVDRPRQAVALLDEALLAYGAAGAEHDAARARRRLRDLGVRRRRTLLPARPQQGMAALTTAEREVVRLVAEGGTNRRVAEQLFLSPHTVNTHLRNAFTKIGVRSRLELSRLVAEQGQ